MSRETDVVIRPDKYVSMLFYGNSSYHALTDGSTRAISEGAPKFLGGIVDSTVDLCE